MTTLPMHRRLPRVALLLAALAFLAAGVAVAQVPVDEDGKPVEALGEASDTSVDAAAPADDLPEYTQAELEDLVGPIALYPDDLLAVVLPASTYPLEIVQAARFLEELEHDSSLEPDESWDESVVALLNYPEVVEMMNDDLDWTWKLGEAVVAQQPDVIAAIESFRDRAYAAGNLQSDGYQKVERNDEGALEIETVEDEIIYVPYYEPERVVVHQPRPVYHYYPQAYPVYYYPYPAHYRFPSRYFWGVTTAFRIGWSSHHLHVFHHSYWGHPYYGRHYFGHFYRQPSISIYNSYYVNDHLRRARYNHRDGDYWRPRRDGGARPGHYRDRIAHFRERRRERTTEGYRQGGDARRSARSDGGARNLTSRPGFSGVESRRDGSNAAARRGFAASRDRTASRAADRSRAAGRSDRAAGRSDDDAPIRFRQRERTGESARSSAADRAAVERRSTSRSARAAPSTRTPSARDRTRSSEVRKRTDPPARLARPSTRSPAASGADRSATPRLSAPRRSSTPSRSTPRSAPAPRSSAPTRSSAPRAAPPRRSSAPRASAPRSSAGTPSRSARPAPSRSRAAPPSRSGRGAGNGTRSREH